MGTRARLILVAIVAAGPVLSACSSLPDLDSLEFFDSKKKLTGDRKPVFPEGVPGVASGVPPELVKGYQEPEGGTVDPAKVAAEAASVEEKPKKPAPAPRVAAVTKPKPKPKPPAQPPQTQAQAPAAQPQQAPTQAAWPTPQPQAAWPTAR
jgi:hypothetical protein